MELKILNSGSSGNCYILESDTEALVIEAGISIYEVKKALDFNIRKIVGVLVSHWHLDHAKYVAEYEKAGIPVFKPYDGMKDMDLKDGVGFKIQAFDLVHDVPCYGFYIYHPNIGNLIYASDTEYIKWRFSKVNYILVESNYSKELVSDIPEKRRHVLTGHMEIDTTCEFLKANNNTGLRSVVLLHLSSDSADAEEFKAKAEKMVDCPVYVAEKGLEISIDLVPFQ